MSAKKPNKSGKNFFTERPHKGSVWSDDGSKVNRRRLVFESKLRDSEEDFYDDEKDAEEFAKNLKIGGYYD